MSTFSPTPSLIGSPGAGAAPSVPRTSPWLAAGAGGVVLVLLAGWLLVVSPQRTEAADLRSSTEQVESNEQALTARVTDLEQEFASLSEHRAALATLRSQMPADAALPDLVRSLRDAAARAGVQLTSLTPSPPVPVNAPAAATTAVAAPDSSQASSAATPTSGDSQATATTDGAVAPAAASGLLQVPVSLTATGGYAALMTFLAELQEDERAFLVSSVDVSPATDSAAAGALVLSVSGAVFALPEDGAAGAASAAPVAPPAGSAGASTTATN